MAHFAQRLIESGFASGFTLYEETYPGRESDRIVVYNTALAKGPQVGSVVDTGSPWCILCPGLAESLGNDMGRLYAPDAPLNVLGSKYRGCFCKATVTLKSEYGDRGLELSPTFFVPDVPESEWPHPSFIGMSTFLNHIRFAVDPSDKAYYFGAP